MGFAHTGRRPVAPVHSHAVALMDSLAAHDLGPSRGTRIGTRVGSLIVWAVLSTFASTVAWGIDLPQDARQVEIHPGVVAFEIRRELPTTDPVLKNASPQVAIWGLVIDRKQPNLKLITATHNAQARGLDDISNIASALASPDQVPIAAINGDYFDMTGPFAGTTSGAMIADGELLRTGSRFVGLGILDDLLSHNMVMGNIDVSMDLTPPTGGRPMQVPLFNRPMDAGNRAHTLAVYSSKWGTSTDTPQGTFELTLAHEGSIPAHGEFAARILSTSDTGNAPLKPGTLVVSVSKRLESVFRKYQVGQSFKLSTRHSIPDGFRQVIGGGPVLVRGGVAVVGDSSVEPRSAMGFDATHVVMVVVDGRAPGYSRGATLGELARFFLELNATDAMNFDGGGSSALWIRNRIINRPSDGQLRPIPNGLALVSTTPVGPPARIVVDAPSPFTMLRGTSVGVKLRVTDANLNPLPELPIKVTSSSEAVRIQPTPDSTTEFLMTSDQPGTHQFTAVAGEAASTIDLRVVDAPAKLEIDPGELKLYPGQQVVLKVTALDEQHHPIAIDPNEITTEVQNGMGQGGALLISAGQKGGSTTVVVKAYGVEARVPMEVIAPMPLPGFAASDAKWAGQLSQGQVEVGDSAVRLKWNQLSPTGHAGHSVFRDVSQSRLLSVDLRAVEPGVRVKLVARLTDKHGIANDYLLFEGESPQTWTTARVAVPPGLLAPVTWTSIQILGDGSSPQGQIELRDWQIMR
jgi:Phosphodiester glycosidase